MIQETRPHAFLTTATSADYKTFLKWILDSYRVKYGSTLSTYWRVLKMRYLDRTGKFLDEGISRDVTNVGCLLTTRDEG